MASNTQNENEGGFSVPLTFFTTTYDQQMPETSFSVPLTTLPEGLNQLVNSVLENATPEDFDFLVNDEYISTTLEKFLRKRGMNYEEIVSVEYTPAMQAQEGSKVPHDDWVSAVRAPLVGNRNVLVTGAYDQCVRVWNGEDCLAIGAGHKGPVKSVAINPAKIGLAATAGSKSAVGSKRKKGSDLPNMQFASAGKDGKVIGWEYDSSSDAITQIGSIAQHVASVDTLDISADGKFLCTGSWDCSAKLFQWEDLVNADMPNDKKQPIVALTDHARPVLSSRFSPNRSNVMATAGLDGSVKFWDINSAKLMTTLKGDHSVNSIALMPGTSHDMVVAGCTDNRVRLFDSRSPACIRSLAGHRQWVYSVAWCWRKDEAQAPGELFISGSEDSTVKVWDTRCTSSSLTTMDSLHTDGVLDTTYVGNMEIASCGKDNKTKTFSLARNTKN